MTTNPELKSFIERIESLEETKSDIASDIKDIFTEAASQGFDKKALRQVIKLRKVAKAEREEQEEMVRVYLEAVGE